METELPTAPYVLEWDRLEKGKNPKLYLSFTSIEMGVPWVFFVIHVVVLWRSILIYAL